MATKSKYAGPHPDVWAEGYMAGVEAGEAMAKREAAAVAAGAAAVGAAAALASRETAQLDAAFGLNRQPAGITKMVGNTQEFR